jgi:uncharacterized membrane protein
MEPGMLDREAKQDDLRVLVRGSLLSTGDMDQALRIAGIIPDGKAWSRFLNILFLVLGALLVVAGIIFFFAYNWSSMHRLLKLGVVQAALLGAAFTASYLGFEKFSGKVTLLAASILTGALLALYGQIYQTGADAYELFLGWSALIAGWVLIGNFAPLWFLLLILLEAAVYLYWAQVVDSGWFFFRRTLLFHLIFAMNAAGLALWEIFSRRKVRWLMGRWIPRTILSIGFFFLVVPLILLIVDRHSFEDDSAAAFLPLLYLGASGFVLWVYQVRLYDLYMIAAVLLSLIVLITVFFAEAIGNDFGGFLVLSILIVGLSAAAAAWLRNIARSHREAS